ncbi:MAG: DUF4091 domain-containing protein [Armatimonadetes bacterium]|nr:DUF4091 domain-containing protein [Armatimonadota bacterium]
MRSILLICLIFSSLAGLSAATGWHDELSDSGSGYWRVRVPVKVENSGPRAAAGAVVALRVGNRPGELPLAGATARSIRACNARGTEYLFRIASRSSRLAAGDTLRLAVDAPGGGAQTYYIYADNPSALPVTDFLKAKLENGSLEQGSDFPAGWVTMLADGSHRASYLKTGGRGNSRCVYHKVDADVPPSWVKWVQSGTRVVAGRRYRVEGWIRAQDVRGTAGWFVHVNGDRPQLINQVLDAGAGSYGWRKISATFTVDVTQGDRPELLRGWYRLLAEHRINVDTIRPTPVFTYESGKVTMDASGFDAMARFCFDGLKMNASYTPWLFYALGWAYRPSEVFGLKPFTPEYEAAYKSAYKLLIDHLTERGWRKHFSLYLSDEPFFDNPQVVSDLRVVIGLAKSVAPDVPVYSSTWRHAPGLDGFLSHWGVGQYGCFPVEKMKERLKAGDKIWFTTDGQQALDTPYLGTERLLPTYCYKYGASGYEFWGVSWWTYDPWKRGWHQFIRQSDQGTDFYWIRYPNGDGYLTYPGGPVGAKGPLPSIRLKAVREGAEDYEYYVLLENAIRQAGKRGINTAEAKRALNAARSLVNIPNAGGMHSTEIMPDPDAVYRVRQAVAVQIVRLGNLTGK